MVNDYKENNRGNVTCNVYLQQYRNIILEREIKNTIERIANGMFGGNNMTINAQQDISWEQRQESGAGGDDYEKSTVHRCLDHTQQQENWKAK